MLRALPASISHSVSVFHRRFGGLLLAFLALPLAAGVASAAPAAAGGTARLPNIVILYADDMGYGDLAIQNPQSKIPTPHIDKLAALNSEIATLTAKADVKGASAHPFYKWALETLGEAADPAWNFHKLLVGRDGRLIAAFGPRTDPQAPEIISAVESALAAPAGA